MPIFKVLLVLWIAICLLVVLLGYRHANAAVSVEPIPFARPGEAATPTPSPALTTTVTAPDVPSIPPPD